MQQRRAKRVDQRAGSLKIGRQEAVEVNLSALDTPFRQREGRVSARQHAAGVDPGRANLRVAIRRLPAEERLSHIAQHLDERQ